MTGMLTSEFQFGWRRSLGDLIVRVRQVAADAELFDEVVLVSHAIFLSAMCQHLLGGIPTDIAFGFCTRVTLDKKEGEWSRAR